MATVTLPAPRVTESVRWQSLERATAALVLFLLPIRSLTITGSGSANLGFALAVGFVFVAAFRAWRYEARWLIGLLTLALATSPLLMYVNTGSGTRVADPALTTGVILFIGNAIMQVITVLWCRFHTGTRTTAAIYALGVTANAALLPEGWADNPWKYAFCWSVTVVVLALVNRRLTVVAALVALIIATALADSRSFLALLAVTLTFVVWRYRAEARETNGRRSTFTTLVVVGLVSAVVYALTIQLAIHGQLGERNQTITIQQTQNGENLIETGRPEMFASFQLFSTHPIGFGPGVSTSYSETVGAITVLRDHGVNIQNDYVDTYLLGNAVELHSVLWDLWAVLGIPGLAAAIGLLYWLIRELGRNLAGTAVSALSIFLLVNGLWDLLFSPIGSNLMRVLAAFALLVPLRSIAADPQTPAKPEERPTGVGPDGHSDNSLRDPGVLRPLQREVQVGSVRQTHPSHDAESGDGPG